MSLKRIKGYTLLPMLLALFIGLMADMACATIEAKDLPRPVGNNLLQFKAGSHIMGFKPDKVYLVNMAGFLSVEFLGAHTVSPKAATVGANQPKNDVTLTPSTTPLTPGSGKTLANLQRVEYPDLWDGITLRYDAAKDGLAESTYSIQPGADVADIQLRYNTDTELLEDGSLKIKLPTQQGYITESSPVAWQILDGKKQSVQVAYEIKDGTIGFKAGTYNKDHELIIDPTYQWHTFYGSGADDYASDIAVDCSGNVYVTGWSNATWGNPVNPHSGNSSNDIVALKLDSSGALMWNTFYGGIADDEGFGIVVAGSGDVYVTGHSYATWGSPLHAYSGDSDIVVMKLDSSGVLVWNTFYGSASYDFVQGIAVDGSGNIYVTGRSDATWGIPLHAYNGSASSANIVVIKLNSSGVYMWHTFYGSASSNYGRAVAVDSDGNVYVTGRSDDTWGSPLHPHSDGPNNYDIVVMKLDSSGVLVWNTFYGSTADDETYGIAVDGSGNVYVTGESYATWGSPKHAHSGSGNFDIMVMKLDSSGVLAWNTFYGGISNDGGAGIAVDGSGNVYVTGYSNATWGSPLHAYSGSSDIVIFKLDRSGAYVWNTFYGSVNGDYCARIAVDGSSNVYVPGSSDVTWGIPLHAHSGGSDIFVLKLEADLQKKFPWPIFLPAINIGK
ncbi:MAG: SBBP repeat-containing protein [Deltaproteobacteria bacterium]|nr:SBBP repeat-containing protein [Deltaproteobacteria bacterium]